MFEKITEQELEVRGVGNVSTTPTKKTPFGESGFDAKQLKERFDLLPRYIAERLNEVLGGIDSGELIDYAYLSPHGYVGDILRGLYDGETAREIIIKTPTRDITVADVAIEVVRLLDELENGELGDKLMFDEETSFKEALDKIEERANESVPNMNAMDKMMFEKFGTGEGDYFFSRANWDDLQRYNRVYVQAYDEENDLRLGEDGKGLYALRAICRYGAGTVPRYPWLKKSDWVARYREANPETTMSDEEIVAEFPPSDSEFGDMATLIERMPNGFIKIPTGFPTDKTEAQMEGYTVPKKYADAIREIALGAVKKIDCPDKNRYVYTTSMNSKGESLISLIKAGENPTPDVNQPLIRRRVNGAVSTIKMPEADDDAASKYFVEYKLAEIVGSAPETLNALNELAAALGNDPNFATTVANQIGAKASQGDLDELSSSILEGLSAILTAQNEILGGGV